MKQGRMLWLAFVVFGFVALVSPVLSIAEMGGESENEGGGGGEGGSFADARLTRAARDSGISYKVDSDGDMRIVLDVGGGRTQLLFATGKAYTYESLEIREIWSVVCDLESEDATNETLRFLLEENRTMKFGAFAILKLDNGKTRVLFLAHVSANANGRSLKDVIQLVAKAADRVEKRLDNGKDDH